ncbi:MAG: hypothetical protein LBL08_02915 [Candidatus Nomurabacteria bacterium]|jgi:hypothetical protein|nr:hypothetical protein [Candidatus Nomurabacteria bacterium]
MDGWRKKLSYVWRRLRRVKTWQLALVLVALLALAVLCMRLNNQNMAQLRAEVIAADKTLDTEKVQQAAENLRAYTQSHMNADTNKIALQNLYNQAVQRAFAAVNNDVDASGYQAATKSCQSVIGQSGYQGYASCVAGRLGVSTKTFKTPKLPNPALYYLNYSSPALSFDLAGGLTLAAIVVFLAIFFKVTTEVILGAVVRSRDKK